MAQLSTTPCVCGYNKYAHMARHKKSCTKLKIATATAAKDSEISALKAAQVVKDNQITSKDAEIISLKADRDAKATEITSMKKEIVDLKSACDSKDKEINALKATPHGSRPNKQPSRVQPARERCPPADLDLVTRETTRTKRG